MAGKSTTRPSNGRLEEALATLITNQAHFIALIGSTEERMARAEERSAERFARIEAELTEIKSILMDHHRILMDHQRILEALPEALREKIGFVKPQ